ncbi:hypothetical protein KEM54_004684 [Ascosphaera aggregata]|nr:hypothetical protein KEM54_004684 [Ascosphaera aggregata]
MASSRVEELPDDYDESQDVNHTPASNQTPDLNRVIDGTNDLTIGSALLNNETPFGVKKRDHGEDELPITGPALPPSMESVRSHTADEILDMINKTPLFMKDIDKAMEGGMKI